MIVLEDGATIVVKLPSGQLVQLRDIRVRQLEMNQGASIGRSNLRGGGIEATIVVRAMGVGYVDRASSDELTEAVADLAEAIGEPVPEVKPRPAKVTPMKQAPIGERVREQYADDAKTIALRREMLTPDEFIEYKRLRGIV